jgi:hypothetical protein
MNDSFLPTPPDIAPAIPVAAPVCPPLPGEPPSLDDEPAIVGWWALLDALLKHPRRILAGATRPASGGLIARLLTLSLLGMAAYGLVVGLFAGDLQIAIVPLKLAGGLLASALICWPSLYILLCLSGATQSAREVAGLFAASLALLVVLMAGFAPVAWIFTQSTHSAGFMGTLHLLLWIVSALFALNRLAQGLATLNGRSMNALPVWCIVFLIVCLQMTTTLRPLLSPFAGWEFAPRAFFLHAWFSA